MSRDPRDYKSLPSSSSKQDFLQCYPSTEVNWIGGEPIKYIFIDQISPKQVHNNLHLVTLLEDISPQIAVKNINLLNLSAERSCASVLFDSGFAAWEFVRKFLKGPKFGWSVGIDSKGHKFDQMFKKIKEREREETYLKSKEGLENNNNNKREKISSHSHRDRDRDRDIGQDRDRDRHSHSHSHSHTHSHTHSQTQTQNHYEPEKRKCSPFVPCLTIPFSCESELSFKLDETIFFSLFPISKFPSISSVETGSSSWHIHFGREVDVVEADRMLQQDDFYWKNHRFFFDRWYLRKNGRSWTIPDHYIITDKVKEKEKEKDHQLKQSEETEIKDFDFDKKLYIADDFIINEETERDNFLTNLPKFIKKRPSLHDKHDHNHDRSEEVKDFDMMMMMINNNTNIPTPIDNTKEEAKEDNTTPRMESKNSSSLIITAVTDNNIQEVREDIFSEKLDNNNAMANGIKFKVKRKPAVKKKPNLNMEILDNVMISISEDSLDNDLEPRPVEVEETVVIIKTPLIYTSARTEGYFVLNPEEKAKVKFPGVLEAFSTATESKDYSNSTLSANRSTRAQNRRPLTGQQSSHIAVDLFKVSPLQSTQKLVVLKNSSIHSYGLVLMEPAEPGDLILEYVGELVRASVANIREWHYEREYCGDGIASSYLFRLDDIMVIDASTRGNLARFINHSCDPNCVAKTITLNGSKRIVMYSKKNIRVGEEITYDYKFPTENDPKKKVKCLCGSSICRKTLN